VKPGSQVALRDIWFGRVWRANAAHVVASSEDEVVLWMPAGSPARYPADPAGAEVRIPNPEPKLCERVTSRDALALLRTGARHSTWLFWDADAALEYWYVNLERTLGWTGCCFDMVDEKLDLIVMPDRSTRWKDEDELEHAATLGLVDAEVVRAEAERVLADWPFPTGWEDFHPDPAWSPPALPNGWDEV
jgi:hypothetical protein